MSQMAGINFGTGTPIAYPTVTPYASQGLGFQSIAPVAPQQYFQQLSSQPFAAHNVGSAPQILQAVAQQLQQLQALQQQQLLHVQQLLQLVPAQLQQLQ